jgi:hypothetical protein
MGCPLRVRLSLLALALCAAVACGGNPESAGAAGTAGTADAPIAITIANTYVTVENRTGAPLLEGEMVIDQLGVRPPFRAAMPRLENGGTRDFTLNTFRAADGTLFNRTIARARSLRITAKDGAGKTYEQEVPFQ